MRHYKGKCIKNPVFLSFGFNSRFMKIHSGPMKNIKNPEGPTGHEYQEKYYLNTRPMTVSPVQIPGPIAV